MSRRPIDPPEIPAWRRAATASEDDTPTLTSLPGADVFDSEETQWEAVPPTDSVAGRWGRPPADDTTTEGPVPSSLSEEGALAPQPLGVPPEDPRELARRLAAEAKAKIAAKTRPPEPPPAEPAPAPAAAPQPPAEDPRELAKRLAAEAKARTLRTPAPAPVRATEDPRELAKRLAAEAKARQNTGQPQPSPVPPPEATPAPAPKASKPSETPTVRKPKAPKAKPKQAPPAGKALSAKEILEAALRGNTAPPERSPAPPPAPAPEAAPAPARAPEVAAAPAPAPAPAPAASAPAPAPQPSVVAPPPAPPPTLGAPPAAVILDLLPGAAVEAPLPVERPDVFQAVWRAHRTRALHERDFASVAMASVLIDAADRVPLGKLVGARVTLHGEAVAVFADVERKCLLAVLAPAEVYLAGLGAS
jgi:hypothetical protein